MLLEKYWEEQRTAFLEKVNARWSDQELIARYKMLMEDMKTYAMSLFLHEDMLRQMIALLFYSSMEGSAMLPVRGKPTVVYEQNDTKASKIPRLKRIMTHPYLRLALLGSGAVLSIFAGLRGLVCLPIFLTVAALQALALQSKEKSSSVPTAESLINKEYLDGFITRQVKQMDQHIEDAKNLCRDISEKADQPFDAALAELCQHVWSVANAHYPAESAVYIAEKLLKKMNAEWVEYDQNLRNAFEIMPTRQVARTIFPAIRQMGDGAIICRGQYVEPHDA